MSLSRSGIRKAEQKFALSELACLRAKYLGGYLVEHWAGEGFGRIFAVGRISKIAYNDWRLLIETDTSVCLYRPHCYDEPFATIDGDNILVHAGGDGICYTILPKHQSHANAVSVIQQERAMSTFARVVVVFLVTLFIGLVVSFLLAAPVKWLWNAAVAPVFGLGQVTWFQAWCLIFFWEVLFSRFSARTKN